MEHQLLRAALDAAKNSTALQGTFGTTFTALLHNDFLTAGIGMILLTWIFQTTKSWISKAYNWITSKFVYTVYVDSDDEAFQWLLEWLAEQPYAKTARNLSVSTNQANKKVSRQYDPYQDYRLQDNKRPTIYFVPAIGLHAFVYKGRLIWFNRNAKQNEAAPAGQGFGGFLGGGGQQQGGAPPQRENISLTMWGRNRTLLEELIKESMEMYYAKSEGKTWIYTCGNYRSNWTKSCERKNRAFESVILPVDTKELLHNDIQTFLTSADWYRACGVPYRRGYLLYGPPGTGKTSFILSIAGKLNMSVCVLNLNTSGMNDERLNELMMFTPQNSIILLEDIDCAFIKKKNTSNNPSYMNVMVTFAGLLNALDGAASQEGRIIFMTTNHLELLSPALIRPGRVDLKVLFDHANEYQIEQMFLKFHPTEKEIAAKIKKLIPSHKVTCAQLQGFFLSHREDPRGVLQNYVKFLKEIDEEKEREAKRKAEEQKDEEEQQKQKQKLQHLAALGLRGAQAEALASLPSPVVSKSKSDPFSDKKTEKSEKTEEKQQAESSKIADEEEAEPTKEEAKKEVAPKQETKKEKETPAKKEEPKKQQAAPKQQASESKSKKNKKK